MHFLWRYLREHGRALALLGGCSLLFLLTFRLYHLPLEAVMYPGVLCLLLLSAIFLTDLLKAKKKHERLEALRSLPDNLTALLEEYPGQEDQDYRELIGLMEERSRREESRIRSRVEDQMEYYTVWVHQIKTPIASMRLKLQGEDTPLARGASEDLFRIEQYVEMVLTYLRLDSDSTDFVFQEHSLDRLIKGCVRKYAGQFIARGLRLRYEGVEGTVVTDEKWFAFVVEQILSNSVKYTEKGSVSIYLEGRVLCIRDTGIGIAPEDLPRIFERGYTGYNGRLDKRASGLGLYLCRRICDKLGIGISAASAVGEGTVLSLHLEQKKVDGE